MKSIAITLSLLAVGVTLSMPKQAAAEFKAGTAIVDVSPKTFPVFVNGGMISRSASEVHKKVNARAIVLDDGKHRIGIVVVDSCMMTRSFLDEVKQLASQRTKIKPNRILISATHTHSAPASMGCLGTDADPTYVPYLREKLAQALAAAEANLEPAQVGWAVEDAHEYTALRRWVRRPDRMLKDPFGNLTVRANMHSGRIWDDATGESGPEDPDLTMLSIQATDGRPIALLANFSMHYFSGVKALDPDYYGRFCDGLQARLSKKGDKQHQPFVGIMSHGCSGDIWRRDYTLTAQEYGKGPTIDSFSQGLVDIALQRYGSIVHRKDVDLAMAETRMNLKYRVPDQQRLEWAQRIVEKMGDRLPKTREEVYAREQIILHERQETEIVLQALRIGDQVIATTPNETYALTGLKLKLQSPLPKTMVIELANGGDGYIPPPEQHYLGGYNTWAARSAGLEVQAEPKIVEALLQLLEKVSGKHRLAYQQSRGTAVKAILSSKPAAYWRMDEMAGPRAIDSSGNNRDGIYEMGSAYFLAGPRSDSFCDAGEQNRATHFAGGRLLARVSDLKDKYSVSLWFWNGMPNDAREVSGWMFSRGRNLGLSPLGDHLGIAGTGSEPGKLIFQHGSGQGDAKPSVGRTTIDRWTWNHVVLVRDGSKVSVYLNGNPQPEIQTNSPANFPATFEQLFFGGRSDNQSNWEGRLDEIALYDRALTPTEIANLQAR